MNDSESLLERARKQREALLAQIRASEDTIAQSRALLARLDDLLAKLDPTEAAGSSGRYSTSR